MLTEDVPSFDALVPGKPGTIVGLGRERAAIWTFSTDGDYLSGPDDD